MSLYKIILYLALIIAAATISGMAVDTAVQTITISYTPPTYSITPPILGPWNLVFGENTIANPLWIESGTSYNLYVKDNAGNGNMISGTTPLNSPLNVRFSSSPNLVALSSSEVNVAGMGNSLPPTEIGGSTIPTSLAQNIGTSDVTQGTYTITLQWRLEPVIG